MTATFRLQVTPPGSTKLSGGGTVYRHDEGVDAHWRFDDGVQIDLRTPVARTTWYGRRSDRTPYRELTRRPRIYVHSEAPFDVIEDLCNRRRRPHQLLKAPATEALSRIGIEGRLIWSQRAGCSCGCSPGFILQDDHHLLAGLDVWVTLPGAPIVDTSKSAREVLL